MTAAALGCKCPMHAHGSAECHCFCLHDGTEPVDRRERWLPIPGHEGRYEVSDYGRVRSLLSRQMMLKGWPNQKGYPSVGLWTTSGEILTRVVHGLVLLAFVGPRPEGLVTRHLDGDPTNNSLENLTYGTNTENALDALRHGRNPYAVQTHCKNGHELTPENTRLSVRSTNGRTRRHCAACDRVRAVVKRDRRRALAEDAREPAPMREGDPF